MKAVLCTRHGPPEALEVVTLPDPEPGPGEVVVDIAAVGLNFFDTLLIRNSYQVKPELPFSPGGEFSGRVSALGAGVSGLQVGDPVCGKLSFGAAREKLAVKADDLVRLPPQMDLVKAAGLIITYGTSAFALNERGGLKSGETLAVLGASGGVGLAAVELGKAMGARVIACASSPEKVAFAMAHGADAGLDYSREDLKAGLKAFGGADGIDMVFDPVGGDLSEPALRALAPGGRLMVVGFAAGEIPKIALNLLLLKNCDARGVIFGNYAASHPEWLRQLVATLVDHAMAGRISAHVDATFPLADCARALGEIAGRRVRGKVVLTT